MRRAACIGLTGLMRGDAWAADYHAGPQNYRERLPPLQAGDRLLLVPGRYAHGLPLRDLSGHAGRLPAPAGAPPR